LLLLSGEDLGKLLEGLLLLLLRLLAWVEGVLHAPAVELAEALAGLPKGADLSLQADRLLSLAVDRLLQGLQRLGALDRLHGVSGHDLLGELHRR